MRDLESADVNIIGTKSQKSDRHAWSTLAAEIHAAQFKMDPAIGVKTFLNKIWAAACSTSVLTQACSLFGQTY